MSLGKEHSLKGNPHASDWRSEAQVLDAAEYIGLPAAFILEEQDAKRSFQSKRADPSRVPKQERQVQMMQVHVPQCTKQAVVLPVQSCGGGPCWGVDAAKAT